jgi:metal-responsive CopG/Arc/MetJ family transcriptional regulator
MPKTKVTKGRISVTIDKDILTHINKECEERTMKVSGYIEKLIKIGLQNENKIKNEKKPKNENQ